MFALGLALLGAAPMAVEATGMEPQLRLVRQQAAQRGWPIVCVGHAGEEGVVRVAIPSGTSRQAVDGFIEAATSVASSAGSLGVNASKQSCDREPVRVESSNPVRTLFFTTGVREPRLLAVAHDCGYAKAFWRTTRPDDVARFGGQLDAKKYFNTLDADEDAAARPGPLACFIQIGLSSLLRHGR